MTTQQAQWRPDVLGEDFQERELELPGGAVATLVKFVGKDGPAFTGKTDSTPAVLYVHGFVDYFFQTHVAQAFARRGYRFYALDLRGHGRSIGRGEPGLVPNYVPNIAVYAQDLDAAVAVIRSETSGPLTLLGHSTGGLITPLYAAARPGTVNALILNSPWLEFNSGWFGRTVLTQLMHLVSAFAPHLPISGLKSYYGRALHTGTGGEWNYDLAWKPHDGFPVVAKWFSSIRRNQARLKHGLNLQLPVLIMTSMRRGDNRTDHDHLVTTDSVLDPRQMWKLANKLGDDVEVRALDGGAHDLALSPEPVRSRYIEETLDWLDRVLGRTKRAGTSGRLAKSRAKGTS